MDDLLFQDDVGEEHLEMGRYGTDVQVDIDSQDGKDDGAGEVALEPVDGQGADSEAEEGAHVVADYAAPKAHATETGDGDVVDKGTADVGEAHASAADAAREEYAAGGAVDIAVAVDAGGELAAALDGEEVVMPGMWSFEVARELPQAPSSSTN